MKDYLTKVVSNRAVATGVYEMTLACADGKFEKMHAGQFLHLEVPGFLLRRPFCIYKFGDNTVSVAYAVVGGGTEQMTKLREGDSVKVTLPLGNGFLLDEKYKRVVLLGGGMGCAPLAYLPVSYPDRKFFAFLGFASKERDAFSQEFMLRAETTVCTDDGSLGIKGYPTDVLESRLEEIKPDIILTCGPKPMLRGVKAFATRHKLPALASLEERMGCGVGACLVCACRIKQKDESVAARRVCADGPVFDLEDVQL